MSLPTITVPNITLKELIEQVKKECKLTYVDSDLENWDFKDGQGKTFEYEIWMPSREVTTQEIRDHFKSKGMTGNVAAFMQFLKEKQPEGLYASIPEDIGCWRGRRGGFCAPYAHFGGSGRGLRHGWLSLPWDVNWSVVGFRECKFGSETLTPLVLSPKSTIIRWLYENDRGFRSAREWRKAFLKMLDEVLK